MTVKIQESRTALASSPATNVVVCEVSGKLKKKDYEDLVPLLEAAIAEHGKIRLLFHMVDFHGWEPSAMWEDTKFAAKHFNDLERIAMVGDKTWEHALAILWKPFTTAKLRYFDEADLTAAEEWIAA